MLMIIKRKLHAGSALTDFQSDDKAEIADYIRHITAPEEIWINGRTDYPCLSMLVNGSYASLIYFEDEGSMWQSCGTHTESITFLAGGEAWEAPADTVISVESAIRCMDSFFDTPKRPSCIRWSCMAWDKQRLIREFNALGIADMEEVRDLNELKGSFINLDFSLPNGQIVKLWEDDAVYLGNQVSKKASSRCYGLATDGDYLLVYEYGENGSDAEIIVLKRLYS